MPIYEYFCPDCNLIFEELKHSEHRFFSQCPKCNGLVRKKISAVNWSFGWRLTDRSLYERFAPKNEYERDI